MPRSNEEPDDRRLHRHLDTLEAELPDGLSVWLRRLRAPRARWVRWPTGLLLICGGFLGFLPVLGFWMLPLGVLLLAIDIPFLQGPTARALDWVERRRQAWRRRRSAG